MSLEELQAQCALWQQRLRLQDWDVTLHLVAPGTLGSHDSHGSVTWQINSRSARISIVESADMAKHDPHYDQLDTLVHELLHLHFVAWDTSEGGHQTIACEQAIWSIARALVVLHGAPSNQTSDR